jgi:chemotaxis protein CheZ
MSAAIAAEKVRNAIQVLKEGGIRERPLVEVLDLSREMADAMNAFFGSLDKSIIGEFRYIAEFIQKARDEIADLQPNEIRDKRIPGASMELDAVVRDTEQATESIMGEAERLMMVEPSDLASYKANVDAALMRIIESCAFQDLTGQRVKKVTTTLRQIEERVTQFATALGVKDSARGETADERRARELLLNGPAIGGPETHQSAVDELFAGAGGDAVSQDDIDALFN